MASARPWAKWVRMSGGAVLLAVFLVAARTYAATWKYGVAAIQTRQASLQIAGRCLQDLARASDACLRRICANDPALVRRTAPRLAQLAVGPYRAPRQ